MFNSKRNILSISYKDDKVRQLLLFQILNLLLFAVAAIMSVLNIITKEYMLFGETAVFAVLCLTNSVLSKKVTIARLLFFIETIILLTNFILTGVPDGFSILWILVVPAAAMSIFGIKIGSVYSTIVFVITVFFFWVPSGQELLRYDYSDTYMLRFPFVYICLYLLSIYVEWIRKKTSDCLIETERKNRWLSRHDALTGAYNRHALYEELNKTLSITSSRETGIIILDIDDFKHINDTYGHNIGDKILCRLSDIIMENICEHCLSCRWGGEEFLVVMRCEHDPVQIAEAIRHDVEQNQMKLENGEVLTFTVSVGVSFCKSVDTEVFIEQVNCADKAMYAAKKAGKNRVMLGDCKS